MSAAEEWVPVLGHEGRYEVSNMGRIKSLDCIFIRSDGRHHRVVGRILKSTPQKSGHLQVTVPSVRNGKSHRTSSVHTIVLEAFSGIRRPEGLDCRHLNGNPADNRLENLKWGTRSENVLDKVRHGTHPQASRPHCGNGHAYTPENTGKGARGSRRCKQCEHDGYVRRKPLSGRGKARKSEAQQRNEVAA